MKTLNIEIILRSESTSEKSVIPVIEHYLKVTGVKSNSVLTQFNEDHNPILFSDIKAIIVEEIPGSTGYIDLSLYNIKWHTYTLDTHGPMVEVAEGDGENDQVNIATHLVLPSAEIFNLWENLYYENNIKENLLLYAQTMMEFSDKGIDTNIINCNRVILLHGPPGTGKTSLCKALSQKLAIRMQYRYHSGILVEINSHNLFSKWFSESGKLVAAMFTKIREIVENQNLLVCVLIDEVESLTLARNQCISGNEPSDSIRVVNAILTQIDQIKRYTNVLILTTSNITESIDLAFIDRADIKQYLGLPTAAAIRYVYTSCLEELIKGQIIETKHINEAMENNNFQEKLQKICEKSTGLSGRTLRKIPFIAHALFLHRTPVSLEEFLEAMDKAIDREKKERKHFENLK